MLRVRLPQASARQGRLVLPLRQTTETWANLPAFSTKADLMDKETFAECFELPLNYYNRTLTEAEWTFYYEELGGMTVRELQDAIRKHMASLKSFPLTSHLRPERKTQILEGNKRKDPRDHPEFNRTYLACINLMHKRWEGDPFAGTGEQTFPIDVDSVVKQAIAYLTANPEKEDEHTILSRARSGIQNRCMAEFENLSW